MISSATIYKHTCHRPVYSFPCCIPPTVLFSSFFSFLLLHHDHDHRNHHSFLLLIPSSFSFSIQQPEGQHPQLVHRPYQSSHGTSDQVVSVRTFRQHQAQELLNYVSDQEWQLGLLALRPTPFFPHEPREIGKAPVTLIPVKSSSPTLVVTSCTMLSLGLSPIRKTLPKSLWPLSHESFVSPWANDRSHRREAYASSTAAKGLLSEVCYFHRLRCTSRTFGILAYIYMDMTGEFSVGHDVASGHPMGMGNQIGDGSRRKKGIGRN